MIDRGEQNHAITWLCECIHAKRGAIHQPMGGENAAAGHLPAVTVFHPPGHSIEIFTVIAKIAVDPVIGQLGQAVCHCLWRTKIHIGHPHCQTIVWRNPIERLHHIPFGRVGVAAINLGIEGHGLS